ncbi:MAG: DUF5718 family protein [Sulfuricurvum sp.]
MERFRSYIGLGIAGNFALHLAQAGELEEFKHIITADEAAPKGMFPFYLPKRVASEMLSVFPLSHEQIKLPNGNAQVEPEVALICDLSYEDGKLVGIKPTHFAAYNDCSIRVAGATKISEKKNWGESSKGLSSTLLEIDQFSSGGVMDRYAICSYLRRDGELRAYGEDVDLLGYSYFYEKLLAWIVEQIQTQKDEDPLEDLSLYIKECDFPQKAIISIGATRYTPYGESTFLQNADEIFVVLYDKTITNIDEVEACIKSGNFASHMSVLHQKVLS